MLDTGCSMLIKTRQPHWLRRSSVSLFFHGPKKMNQNSFSSQYPVTSIQSRHDGINLQQSLPILKTGLKIQDLDHYRRLDIYRTINSVFISLVQRFRLDPPSSSFSSNLKSVLLDFLSASATPCLCWACFSRTRFQFPQGS